MNDKDFGKYLRAKRNERGVTLKELANLLNMSFSYLSQIERGERKLTSIETIYKLIEQLKVDKIEFLVNVGATNEVNRLHLKELENILNLVIYSGTFNKAFSLNAPLFSDVINETISEFTGKKVPKEKIWDLTDLQNELTNIFNTISDLKSREIFLDTFKRVPNTLNDRTFQNHYFEKLITTQLNDEAPYLVEGNPTSQFFSTVLIEFRKIKFENNLDNKIYLEFLNEKKLNEYTSIEMLVNGLTSCFVSLVDTESRELMLKYIPRAIEDAGAFLYNNSQEALDLYNLHEYIDVYFNGRLLTEDERELVTRTLRAILNE